MLMEFFLDDEEITVLLEAFKKLASDSDMFDELAELLDLSDNYMIEFREKVLKILNPDV
jgi:hypothetical protein